MKLSINYLARTIALFMLGFFLILDILFGVLAKDLTTFLIFQCLWGSLFLFIFFVAIAKKFFSVVHVKKNTIELKHFGKILQSYPLESVHIHFAILFTPRNARNSASYKPCLVFSKNETDTYIYRPSTLSKNHDRFLLVPRKKDWEKLLALLPYPIVLPAWIALEDYLITGYDDLNAFDRIEAVYGLISQYNAKGVL